MCILTTITVERQRSASCKNALWRRPPRHHWLIQASAAGRRKQLLLILIQSLQDNEKYKTNIHLSSPKDTWKTPRSTGGQLFALIRLLIWEDTKLTTHTPSSPGINLSMCRCSKAPKVNAETTWAMMWLHVNNTFTLKASALALDKQETEMNDEEWAASLKPTVRQTVITSFDFHLQFVLTFSNVQRLISFESKWMRWHEIN